jgi:hypothetical protein
MEDPSRKNHPLKKKKSNLTLESMLSEKIILKKAPIWTTLNFANSKMDMLISLLITKLFLKNTQIWEPMIYPFFPSKEYLLF